MMTAPYQMPQKPNANATDAELRAYLGDLLDLASNQGVAALRLQGFSDQDMFELRRLSTAYRNDTGTVEDLKSLRQIAKKLRVE